MGLVKKYNNVIVLRTLSKGYSLAGLRLGFGIADPQVLQGILKVKDSYNVSAMAIRIGAAALRDQAYLKQTTAKVIKIPRGARRRVSPGSVSRSGPPSPISFLSGRRTAMPKILFQYLRRRGILVRHFNKPGIKDKLRISIGTPEEIEVLPGRDKTIPGEALLEHFNKPVNYQPEQDYQIKLQAKKYHLFCDVHFNSRHMLTSLFARSFGRSWEHL